MHVCAISNLDSILKRQTGLFMFLFKIEGGVHGLFRMN